MVTLIDVGESHSETATDSFPDERTLTRLGDSAMCLPLPQQSVNVPPVSTRIFVIDELDRLKPEPLHVNRLKPALQPGMCEFCWSPRFSLSSHLLRQYPFDDVGFFNTSQANVETSIFYGQSLVIDP